MRGEHFSKQYDADLETIRSKVLLMGGLVEHQFQQAIHVFQSGNLALAERIIQDDEQVNRLEIELDDACSHIIVLRQPTANDLRTVMATIKVITDLERIGDEAVKIARTAIHIHRDRSEKIDHSVQTLANRAIDLLHNVLDALARLDEKQATKLITQDMMIDHDFQLIMRSLEQGMINDPSTVAVSMDTMWVAKAIERIGDHAKNIAEYVIYIVHGKDIRHTGYAVSQLDE